MNDTDSLMDLSLHVLDLCENSIRAGANLIRITMEKTADVIMTVISDDGSGMSDADVAEVMRRTTSQSPKRHTGLGIPSAKEFAAKHGGTLFMHSACGKGCTTGILIRPGAQENPGEIVGSMSRTVLCLLAQADMGTDVEFEVRTKEQIVTLDSRKIREMLAETDVTLEEYIGGSRFRHTLEEQIDPIFGGS